MKNTDEQAHTPEYIREHYRLDSMPVGSKTDTKHGYVVRVKPTEYCLRQGQPSNRARWGTAAQIAEDIAYLDHWGTLPPASSPPW